MAKQRTTKPVGHSLVPPTAYTVKVQSLPALWWKPLGPAMDAIAAVLGDDESARRDLAEQAYSGKIKLAGRVRLRLTGEECYEFRRWCWRFCEIVPDPWRVVGDFPWLDLGQWEFFVDRAALATLYPESGAAEEPKPVKPETQTAQPAREGRPANYDWPTIYGEIARRCVDNQGRVQVPKNQNQLAEKVALWCQQRGMKGPGRSMMATAVAAICKAMRTTQK